MFVYDDLEEKLILNRILFIFKNCWYKLEKSKFLLSTYLQAISQKLQIFKLIEKTMENTSRKEHDIILTKKLVKTKSSKKVLNLIKGLIYFIYLFICVHAYLFIYAFIFLAFLSISLNSYKRHSSFSIFKSSTLTSEWRIKIASFWC